MTDTDKDKHDDFLHKGLGELKALRTELEKAVKTASEDAKEGWKKIQPHLQEAERLAATKASEVAQEVGESAGEFITDVRGRLEKLRDRIRSESSGT
jgi:ElaB/YqjD/DUF883 family membrane-anchored ribosome-binding protein